MSIPPPIALALLLAFAATPACNCLLGITPGTPAVGNTGGGGWGGADGGGGGDVGGGGGTAGGGVGGGEPDSGMRCPPYELPPPSTPCAAEYLSDSENCCVRGRSCLGGSCESGKCSPVLVLAPAHGTYGFISADGDELFFPQSPPAKPQKCNTDGGGLVDLSTQYNPWVLRPFGTRVLFFDQNANLVAAPRDGSGSTALVSPVPISGVTSSGLLKIAGPRAFWRANNPASLWYVELQDAGISNPRLLAIASSAGLADAGVDLVEAPYDIVVDSSHVYWSDPSLHLLKRRPLATLNDAGAGEDFLTDQFFGALAIDDLNLYWSHYDTISFRPKDGSSGPQDLGAATLSPEILLADDQYVYWAAGVWGATWAVGRVRKDRQGYETLVSGSSGPVGLAQDCASLYYAAEGKVMRLAK